MMAKAKKIIVKQQKEWMSVLELAEYLGVSKENLYRKASNKAFPKHRFGKLLKFNKTEIDNYLTKR